jgi:hypothetical protein
MIQNWWRGVKKKRREKLFLTLQWFGNVKKTGSNTHDKREFTAFPQ